MTFTLHSSSKNIRVISGFVLKISVVYQKNISWVILHGYSLSWKIKRNFNIRQKVNKRLLDLACFIVNFELNTMRSSQQLPYLLLWFIFKCILTPTLFTFDRYCLKSPIILISHTHGAKSKPPGEKSRLNCGLDISLMWIGIVIEWFDRSELRASVLCIAAILICFYSQVLVSMNPSRCITERKKWRYANKGRVSVYFSESGRCYQKFHTERKFHSCSRKLDLSWP